jgi:hypothetical protein
VGVCAVAAVGLLAAGIVVLDGGGSDHPDAWDERVVPLVEFVERERGLSFDHPVTVEFLTEDEYSEAVRFDDDVLSEEEREGFAESAAALEALGLVPVGTDLLETSNDLVDSGTLAFYDPFAETVVVRGTEMTTGVEATLVHELVHVAQDQAFDLTQPPPVESTGAYEAYDALVEGDATRIEYAYIDTLSPDVQEAYWDDYMAGYDASRDDLADVPVALEAMLAAPYVLGSPLVELIAADGGNAAVDAAFADPPRSSEHLLDPRSFFDGDDPVDVDEPELPTGAEQVGEGDTLGATMLYIVLAERIDPMAALTAADGWGGDAFVTYREADRACVRADFVGDSATDTDELAQALRSWVDAGAVGDASVDVAAGVVAFESCAGSDGGAEPHPGRAVDALAVPAARSGLMAMAAADGGYDNDDAFAFGACFVERVGFESLVEANGSEPSAAVADEIDAAMTYCAST